VCLISRFSGREGPPTCFLASVLDDVAGLCGLVRGQMQTEGETCFGCWMLDVSKVQ
jgi:hypothetical protein